MSERSPGRGRGGKSPLMTVYDVERYKETLSVGDTVMIDLEHSERTYEPGDAVSSMISYTSAKILAIYDSVVRTKYGCFQCSELYKWNVLVPKYRQQVVEQAIFEPVVEESLDWMYEEPKTQATDESESFMNFLESIS